MHRKATAAIVVLVMLAVVGGVAQAAATRASKTVQGVRFTLDEWANYVLSDKATQACAMLTKHGQAVWAKQNSSSSCVVATKADYKFLKQYPTDAKAVRDYGNTQPVKLQGDTATVPKLAGGDRQLLYIDGLWYINS
jgi:hypothetical protein